MFTLKCKTQKIQDFTLFICLYDLIGYVWYDVLGPPHEPLPQFGPPHEPLPQIQLLVPCQTWKYEPPSTPNIKNEIPQNMRSP